MTRDHADLDTLLSPLAARGAPAGFAARLCDRYAHALAARRRRAALMICAASFVALAAIVVACAAVLQTMPLQDWLASGVSGIAAITRVAAHALVHPLVHDFPAVAAGIVAMAAITAGCCVALAAIVRGAPVSSRAH